MRGGICTIEGIPDNPTYFVPTYTRYLTNLHYKSIFTKLYSCSTGVDLLQVFSFHFRYSLMIFLTLLFMLRQPTPGIPLLLYLSVTDHALSSVILQEIDKEQKAIYFVSRVLQGAEVMYQKIEKLALALVVIAQRLRPYFQSY